MIDLRTIPIATVYYHMAAYAATAPPEYSGKLQDTDYTILYI